MEYFDSRGRLLELESIIGRGGEGTVYEVNGRGGTAAKIYHKPIDDKKSRKLSAMVKVKNDRLSGISAWPQDTVHSSRGGPICGILMPKITGYKEIHKLYSPRTRILEFPYAGWDFLIHAAANLARAFSVIHEQGHIIGDINHGNIVVSGKATVMLIDCDSLQISHGGEIFPCEVGVSTHQPPELQGLDSLTGVIRTPNHDNFGLAVLIFQLLFMGRHPFSGRFRGQEEMQLEKAIIDRRFVYAERYSDHSELPPGGLTLKVVSKEVGSMFEQAFLEEVRPSAKEWITALGEQLKQVKVCSYNMSHRYLRSLNTCPWCIMEKSTGAMLFSPIAGIYNARKTAEIEKACEEIINFPSPGPPPKLSGKIPLKFNASQEYRRYSKYRRVYAAVIFIMISWVILMCFGYNVNMPAVALSLCFSPLAAVVIPNRVPEQIREKVKMEYDETLFNLNMLHDAWLQEDEHEFLKMKEKLTELVDKYKKVDSARMEKLKDLQFNRKKHQLERYLRAFNISTARVPGVDSSCRSILKSHGIENAADVDDGALRAFPEIPSPVSKNLIKWRNELEEKFIFDPKRGVERDEIMDIEDEALAERSSLEKSLLAGFEELKMVNGNIVNKRKYLIEEIKKCRCEHAQAKANLIALRGFRLSAKDEDTGKSLYH